MDEEHNIYGSAPGIGLTLPPYYQPTPSVKNKTNYFPQAEPLGPDEMRIIFMGSQPWPPRMTQAGTCIMVELGIGKRFFFDFGPGCLRNIIANQVPVPEINDIFLTHLHMDHVIDIPYLWQFAPSTGAGNRCASLDPPAASPNGARKPWSITCGRWACGPPSRQGACRWRMGMSTTSPSLTSGTTAVCAMTRTAWW